MKVELFADAFNSSINLIAITPSIPVNGEIDSNLLPAGIRMMLSPDRSRFQLDNDRTISKCLYARPGQSMDPTQGQEISESRQATPEHKSSAPDQT